MKKLPLNVVWFVCLALLGCLRSDAPTFCQEATTDLSSNPGRDLASKIEPWMATIRNSGSSYAIHGSGTLEIDGRSREVTLDIAYHNEQSFDFSIVESEYAVSIRRRQDSIAFAVPKHKVAFIGKGDCDATDHLAHGDLLKRLISSGTWISNYLDMALSSHPEDLCNAILFLTRGSFDLAANQCNLPDVGQVSFTEMAPSYRMKIQSKYGVMNLDLSKTLPPELPYDDWPDFKIKKIDRAEIERTLARGIRRALEVLAPSTQLTSPKMTDKRVPHGELRWIDGQRVVLLNGTPEEIGKAHGELLGEESMRCVDSVLHAFATAQTIATGKWFREELEIAYARLGPHIPERHKRETVALANALHQNSALMEAVNVFPELFHCSGFAVFGSATIDGKLYHGRVLDYMTTIGLQDAATTFIVSADEMIPFANVGYAGFIGSVSGMNTKQISLGEMGGRGEGAWDGVPMATLMRRALEECSTLDDVKKLWATSPRTCEYYYVFADGKDRSAVGVAATPESIQFVKPGESHPLLGEGIRDAVVLSAGSRLEELKRRVNDQHGKIDASVGQSLMCRPVAMSSNLHNVLFVPEDGVLYVANADHKKPAADRPYVKLNLNELVESIQKGPETSKKPERDATSRYEAKDTLHVDTTDCDEDTRECLAGLTWTPDEFEVTIEKSDGKHGDYTARFPSARPVGDPVNDLVAMEWYPVMDDQHRLLNAPAMVVVHESGRGMTVGRLIARWMAKKGLHAFMIQMPFYGDRRSGKDIPASNHIVSGIKQAIADVRRAKDAISAIPEVDDSRISLQGTSLGGFVAATTAGIDSAFHKTFILLAGGDLMGVLNNGRKDAAKFRAEFSKAGVTDLELRKLVDSIEPLRLASRIDAQNTWLYSGQYDDVVPLDNAIQLAKAANLPSSHHVRMLADHYTGVVFLPMIVQEMAEFAMAP